MAAQSFVAPGEHRGICQSPALTRAACALTSHGDNVLDKVHLGESFREADLKGRAQVVGTSNSPLESRACSVVRERVDR
jgi:tRNA C32,U32 (ribose-2'-O)-methylase TrmJ